MMSKDLKTFKLITVLLIATCIFVALFTMYHSSTIFKVEKRTDSPVSGVSFYNILPDWKPSSKSESEAKSEISVTKKDDNFTSTFSMNQHDPRLWDYIRKNHLTEPSNKPYNLGWSGVHGNSFTPLLDKLFKYKRNGYFIEAGAYDGEIASNTLYFEQLGWKGLLVECNPILLPKLRAKNRKAWIADVCLSPSDKPEMLNFTTPVDSPGSARLGKPMTQKEMMDVGIGFLRNKTWLEYQIPCFPLYSILSAVGGDTLPEIDFFSLDIELAEFGVLKGFPFEKFKIKVIMIEMAHYTEEVKTDFIEFMESKDYDLFKKLEYDYLFCLKDSGFALSHDELGF